MLISMIKNNLYLIQYFIKHILFLAHVVGIVLYEYILNKDFMNNVLHKLSKKNILYVKLFQACALNNSICNNKLNTGLNDKLMTFCDNAPWTLNDIDLDTLEQLERKYQIRILDKQQPINAGMISLVYKGMVAGTKPIIVKIKRKNIEERLNAAIEHVLFVLMLVDWVPFLNTFERADFIKSFV